MSGVHAPRGATPAPDEDFRVYYRPRNLSSGTHPHDDCDDVVVSYHPPPRVPTPTAHTEPPTATTATRHLAQNNKHYWDLHASTDKEVGLGTAMTEATSPPPEVSESATSTSTSPASESSVQVQHVHTPETRHEDELDGATAEQGWEAGEAEAEAEAEGGSHATTRESERQPDDVAAAAAAPQKAPGVRRAAKRKTRAAVVDALKVATLVSDGAEGQRAHDDEEGTTRKKALGAAKPDASRPVATEHTKKKENKEKSDGVEGSNKRAEEAVLEVTLAEAERVYRQAKEHLDLCQGAAGAYTRRDEDEEEMARFWQDHVLQRKPGSLYVSGSPGTGKTLTLSRVIEKMKQWERKHREDAPRCIVVELNGMQVRAEQIEEAIIEAIAGAPGRRLEDLLTDPRRPHMTVVVLDELDQLIMAKQADILYKLFEITALPRSSLVFIGVANALRLKESLPLLQTAKYGDVKQMTFESYSAAQLLGILKGRQAKMGCRLFDDAALQLCASQAAKMSGDARKALHLATLAVEEALKDLPGNWGSQAQRGLPRVSVQQMSQAMAGALGQVSKRVVQIRGLPTLQQLLLCCLVVARAQLATRVSGPLPWKVVFDTYKAVCTRDGFGAVTPSEFSDMCAALEGHALITTTKAKGKGSQQGLLLQVSDSELRSAVQPTRSLARVLPDAA